MGSYKENFIGFLLGAGALKVAGDKDFSLKSKRLSPYFVNIGDFNEGVTTARLADGYADAIRNTGIAFDSMYGIPEKGVALVVATAISLGRQGVNTPWFFVRKIPKEYGEATNLSKEERRKKLVLGRAPQDGQRILLLDDVFTTGDTKYESVALLNGILDNPSYPALVIAVDRQEIGIDGKSAIETFTQQTGIPVVSILSATDIVEYLRSRAAEKPETAAAVRRMENYLRVYGTATARKDVGKAPQQRIIERDKSVIPACDVSTLEGFEELVSQTADIEGIGGYKIGFELGLGYGLPRVVEVARKHTDKPLIYDHQKGGTDIPDTGKNFARVCKKAGINAVIFFPQAGPETERAWIYHALDNELGVIVGGRMTHPAFAQSEGGFITDEGALEMQRIAARAGVNHFVVPGNKPDVIKVIREAVEAEGVEPVFYAPGFVAQGGKIEEATKVAGDRWHAIAGRAITEAADKRKAALELTSQI